MKTSSKYFKLLTVVAIAATTSPAFAYFKVDNGGHAATEKCGLSRVRQVGSGAQSKTLGKGNNVPLREAAMALAPAGWHVKISKGAKGSRANWTQDTPWVSALSTHAPKRLCYVVDWDNRWLVVSSKKLPTQVANAETGGTTVPGQSTNDNNHKPKATVTKLTSKSSDKNSANNASVAKQVDAAVASNADEPKPGKKVDHSDYGKNPVLSQGGKARPGESHHIVNNGKTISTPPKSSVSQHKPSTYDFHAGAGDLLSHSLSTFLKKRGWHVAWNSPLDYPIKYPLDVSGASIRQILNKVANLYPVKIRLYQGNRVVAIQSANNASAPIGG